MTTPKTLTSITAAFALGIALFGALPSAQAASSNQFQTRNTTPPPTGPTSLATKQRVSKDIYCGPGHVPCDNIFTSYCALIGGHMSKTQPWGGKTCFHNTKW